MEQRYLKEGDVQHTPDGPMQVIAGVVGGTIELVPLDGPEPNSITGWWALVIPHAGGPPEALYSKDHDSIDRVHEYGRAIVIHMNVLGHAQTFRVACVPEHGESLRMFTRRGILDATSPNARVINMPILELRRADGSFVRLNVHPEHGLVMSSMDLNITG